MIYEGIFGRTFTLFYGEQLRFFYEIEDSRGIGRTEEEMVAQGSNAGTPGSKYRLLNQILSVRENGSERVARRLLEDYLQKSQMVEGVFILKGSNNE